MRSNLFDIINTHGKLISGKEIDYRKNVMSKFRWTNEWVGKDEKNKEYPPGHHLKRYLSN